MLNNIVLEMQIIKFSQNKLVEKISCNKVLKGKGCVLKDFLRGKGRNFYDRLFLFS